MTAGFPPWHEVFVCLVDNIWPPARQSWHSLDMAKLRAIQAITGWVTWWREQITSSQVVCLNTIYPIRWGSDLFLNQLCGNPISPTINSLVVCLFFFFPPQRAEPFHNYTGCIQIIEINNMRNFHTSGAIAGTNIAQCRWRLSWCSTSLSCSIIPVKFDGFRIKYLSNLQKCHGGLSNKYLRFDNPIASCWHDTHNKNFGPCSNTEASSRRTWSLWRRRLWQWRNLSPAARRSPAVLSLSASFYRSFLRERWGLDVFQGLSCQTFPDFRSDFDLPKAHERREASKIVWPLLCCHQAACHQLIPVNICWASLLIRFTIKERGLCCIKNLESYELLRIMIELRNLRKRFQPLQFP